MAAPKIQANAHALFAHALPGNAGGHVLALREYHAQTEHLHYLADHLGELGTKHRVGAIALEHPATLMMFQWAYRDAKTSEEKKTAKQNLHDALQIMSVYTQNVDYTVRLMTEAIDRGITVVDYDGRYAFHDGYAYNAQKITAAGASLDRPFAQMDKPHQALWFFKQAKALYDAHPEYKAKMDAIDATVMQMQRSGVPMDVISATLATQAVDKGKNMISVSGAVHVMGGTYGGNSDAQGIFDDGLAAAGWKVTDGFLGTKQEMREYLTYLDPKKYSILCGNRDQADFALLTDTDEMATRIHTLPVKESTAVKQQLAKMDPCANAPAVEKVYSQTMLHPSTIPGVAETIAALHKAMHAPTHGVKTPTTRAPDEKRR